MRPTFWTVAYAMATVIEATHQSRPLWIIVGCVAVAVSLRPKNGVS